MFKINPAVQFRAPYLYQTDEDDEDGGRAAIGSFQVLFPVVFWEHPLGDGQVEPLAAASASLRFAVLL